MKMRIRNKWRNKDRHGSIDDNATALAYVIWQIALTATKNLHAEEFLYQSDQQRVAVVAEYLIFLCHVADRFAYDILEDEQRQSFVATLVDHVARHYQRNLEDILGSGDYKQEFIAAMNARFTEYAQTQFDADGPGYQTRRCLGEKIQDVMGMDQINKWVIQQIMDLDAKQAVDHLRQGMDNLFATSSVDLRPKEEGAVFGPD